jgi:hypothetical protein
MAEKTVKALPLVPAQYDSVNESINRRTIEQALQDLYSEVGHVKDMQESGISKAVKRHIFLLMGASHCCFNGGSISMMLTALAGIKLPDDEKIFFGDSNDMEIYHSGVTSFIKDAGVGNLEIWGDGGLLIKSGDGTEFKAKFITNDAVELYYNNSKKFETTNTGAKFSGDAVATDEFRGEVVNYASNQDAPYLIAGTSGYTGANTNWNTFGFQHRIKSDSGGVPRVTIDTSSAEAFNVTNNNRIGIGTSSPQAKLTLENGLQRINATDGSSDARIQFTMTNGSNFPSGWIGIPNWNKDGLYIFGPTANGSEVAALYTEARWQFNTGGSERARIDSSGRLGVNTTSLDGIVTIKQSSNSDVNGLDGIRLNASSGTTYAGFGLVNATGTLAITAGDAGGSNDTEIVFRTATSGSESEKARITSTGRLGLNTTNPTTDFEVNATGANGIKITSDQPYLFFNDTDNAGTTYDSTISFSGDSLYIGGASAASIVRFRNKASFGESARIDTNGNVITGKTSVAFGTAGSVSYATGLLTATVNGGACVQLNRLSTDGVIQTFSKDSSTVGKMRTYGSDLIIQNEGAGLRFNDGNNAIHPVVSAGSVSDNLTDLGLTNARFKDLRLGGTGYFGTSVGIGTTSTDAPLTIHNSSDPEIRFGYSSTQDHRITWDSSKVFIESDPENANGNSAIGFRVDGSEKARIDNNGSLLVSGTTVGEQNSFAAGSSGNITISRQSGDPRTMISFLNGGSTVGTVQTSTTATSYNTSSDARLKDVTGEAKGLEIINKLNPVSYNWKFNNKSDEGLIAQEVKDVVPNAVTGSEEDYYMMDYSKLVTPLVKAVQEQQKQIETLKSEIAKLKGE